MTAFAGGTDAMAHAIDQALSAAHRDQAMPDWMQLPDVVGELDRWLDDERQWNARGSHWASLIDDMIAAINAFGTEAKKLAASTDLVRQLEECRGMLNRPDTRTDPALRRRLRQLAHVICERFRTDEMLLTVWADLGNRISEPDAAEAAARRLLALGTWLGHGSEELRNGLSNQLSGLFARAQDEEPPPAAERLSAAEDVLRESPRRARTVVWLQFIFAKVDHPGWIDIGDSVRIYQGAWLRDALADPSDHHELPPEATAANTDLKMFCGVVLDGDEHEGESPESADQPIAYMRVDVGDELVSRAVEVARDTAEALSALGVLYGAEPTIWRLDDRHLRFVDGEQSGSFSIGAPVVESPTIRERIGVSQDHTAQDLRALAERLGVHLPVRDPDLHAATTLLGWLRDARNSPEPLRLVLFDRVIEAVCGWAGVSSPSRFVHDYLIPWWAYGRMRSAIFAAGRAAIWSTPLSRQPEGSPERETWLEIYRHPPLGLADGGERLAINLRGVLTETQWLLERLPDDSDGAREMSELAKRTVDGKAALAWWLEICKQAERMEARRLRTRNALVHGGPIAPATVGAVAAFAEHLAGEALAASVEGHLEGQDLIDYFLERSQRLSEVRSQLRNNQNASEVLFWSP